MRIILMSYFFLLLNTANLYYEHSHYEYISSYYIWCGCRIVKYLLYCTVYFLVIYNIIAVR